MSIGGHYLSFICIFTEVFFLLSQVHYFRTNKDLFNWKKISLLVGVETLGLSRTHKGIKKEEERSIHISWGLKWSVWSSGSFFLYFFMFLTSCLRHESLDAHGLFLHRPFNKKKQKGTRGSSSSLLFVCSWHRRYTTSFPVAKGTTMLPPWRFRFLMGTKENVSSLLRFFRY